MIGEVALEVLIPFITANLVNSIKAGAELNSILKEEIVGLLLENDIEKANDFIIPEMDTPYIILVVGVNGVGKTTTAINLAASLATLDKKVLLIDADPQANSSSGLGVDPAKVNTSVYDILIGSASATDAIMPTCVDRLDIVPSRIDLVGAELELLNIENREQMLRKQLRSLRNMYDYILIDCSPSLGLITVNCLTAADSVITPVQAEYFALEGISKLLNTIKIIKSKLNPKLQIEGFLLTMYDARLRLANQIYEEVKRHFQKLVFDTVIQRNIRLSEAPSFGLPALLYSPDSKGSQNYMMLARELLAKHHDTIKN